MNRVTTAAVMAALLPLVATPAAGAASLLPGGDITVLAHGPLEKAMPGNLQGKMCPSTRPCTTVPYVPLNVILIPGVPVLGLQKNITTLNDYIESPDYPGKKVVFAYSGGARDTLGWMEEHAGDANAPSQDDLSFVLIGNPTRQYGGSSSIIGGGVMDPNTVPYDVLDIAQQYDFISDFPQNPLNLLALANAVAGFMYLHLDYEDVNVDDPNNYVWTEGKVTYVFVPTENLPLLEPLRRDGLGWLADELNAPLKAIVEQGYNRSWLPSEPQGDASSDVTTETVDSVQPRTLRTILQSSGRSRGAAATNAVVGGSTDDTHLASSETVPDPVSGDPSASASGGPDTKTEATDAVESGENSTPTQTTQTTATKTKTTKTETTKTTETTETTEPSTGTASSTTNVGAKHRLPRTSLRDKLFNKPATKADGPAAAKSGVTSSSESGATKTGGTGSHADE